MSKSSSFDNILVHGKKDVNGATESFTEPANVNDLLLYEKNNFKGWECWAGLQNITIDNEGNVWRAICRQGQRLGNIHDDFNLATDTIICGKEKCNCAADIQLSKALPGHRSLLRVGHE